MQLTTTEQLTQYTQGIAADNGVTFEHIYTGKAFNVEPSVQQKLEKKVQQSSAFLGMINLVPVIEQAGQTFRLRHCQHHRRGNGYHTQPTQTTRLAHPFCPRLLMPTNQLRQLYPL